MLQADQFLGMHLGDPDIAFVKLAQSQGVGGIQVTKSAELEKALRQGPAKLPTAIRSWSRWLSALSATPMKAAVCAKPPRGTAAFSWCGNFEARANRECRSAGRGLPRLLDHTGLCFRDLAVDEFVGQEPILIEALELFEVPLDR